MKKPFIVLLAVILAFTFAGCGQSSLNFDDLKAQAEAIQATPTPAPTSTPTPTQTSTPTPTSTPKPTPKPTSTPKPTPKPTATPNPTAKPTPTPKPTSTPKPASDLLTEAMEQYNVIIGQAATYNYGANDPTGDYRYALVYMKSDADVPALLLEQDTASFISYVLVFQYDSNSGKVTQVNGTMMEGTASAGGYRGGLSAAGDGNGVLSTEFNSGTGQGSTSRITLSGNSLQSIVVWEGMILDNTNTISSKAIDWKDIPKSNPVATQQPITAQVQNETPTVTMSAVSSVTASCYLEEPQYGLTHGPTNVTDGSLSTAWVENAYGQGEGESITLNLSGKYRVSGFTINAGYQKSASTYENNSRPYKLRVSFSDGNSVEVSLEDTNTQQRVTFNSAVETSSVTFTIVSVYAGSKYEDTAITEISLF